MTTRPLTRPSKTPPDAHSKKLSLLAPLRPYCEQLLNQGQVRPGDVAVRGLARAARAIAPQLERYFRITCDDTQSDIAIACKVLRKFGLFPRRDKKEPRRGGGNDARQWNYTLDTPARCPQPLRGPIAEGGPESAGDSDRG